MPVLKTVTVVNIERKEIFQKKRIGCELDVILNLQNSAQCSFVHLFITEPSVMVRGFRNRIAMASATG